MKNIFTFFTIIFLLFTSTHSLLPQTEEQQKHPLYPEVVKHYNAYQEANQKGDYDTALKEAEKALELAIQVFGKEDATTTIFYNNLGEAYRLKGEYDKAIEFQNKASAILKDSGNRDNNLTALSNQSYL